jgi:hypothetical protein
VTGRSEANDPEAKIVSIAQRRKVQSSTALPSDRAELCTTDTAACSNRKLEGAKFDVESHAVRIAAALAST